MNVRKQIVVTRITFSNAERKCWINREFCGLEIIIHRIYRSINHLTRDHTTRILILSSQNKNLEL